MVAVAAEEEAVVVEAVEELVFGCLGMAIAVAEVAVAEVVAAAVAVRRVKALVCW